MSTYKTPQVYVEETSLRPPSVTEVETGIPAFIGYTRRATRAAPDDLLLVPTPIASMLEFEQYFGDAGATGATVHITSADGTPTLDRIDDPTAYYPLYFAMQMFYANGGGGCVVVSVGARAGSPPALPNVAVLTAGLNAIAAADDPTLIVVPEAVSLAPTDYAMLATATLAQCSERGDRFAIFDLYDGGNPNADIDASRNLFATTPDLRYGAVYYPFLRTTLPYPYVETETRDANGVVTGVTSNVMVTLGDTDAVDAASLRSNVSLYDLVTTALRDHHVTMPPSAAVAGVYAATDRVRGVWKAPANIPVANVIAPVIPINDVTQQRLNVDPATGKSINVIRAFVGKGTLVWGARTLAGNDNEWRYVSVRRFFIMVEESVKKSTQWVVFEPNDATTWTKVRSVIESYLTTRWRDGALLGTTVKEAFFVACGLGSTMSAQDILDGRLIVEIGMAVARPAEFIILRIYHQVRTA